MHKSATHPTVTLGNHTYSYPKCCVVVLAIAFLLRLAWALLIPVVPVSDSVAYQTFAINILEHGVYGWTPQEPSAYWPVGTSAIYALTYWIFGQNHTAAIVINLATGLLIVFLTMKLASIWFNRQIGIVAGLLTAAWPMLIEQTTIIASESFFTALMLLAFATIPRRQHKPSNNTILMYALCGLVCGLAALVKPIALLFPIIFSISLYHKSGSKRESLKCVVLSSIIMVLVVAPWTYRNFVVFDAFVPISTNGGSNFWMGNNPETTGEYLPLPQSVQQLNEVERDRALKNKAIDYIFENPVSFVFRSLIKSVRLYERETIGTVWNEPGIEKSLGRFGVITIKILSQAYWIAVLGLFGYGVFLAFRSSGFALCLHPAILMIAYTTTVYAIMVIQDRYHVPLDPLIAMIASLAIVKLIPSTFFDWVLHRKEN